MLLRPTDGRTSSSEGWSPSSPWSASRPSEPLPCRPEGSPPWRAPSSRSSPPRGRGANLGADASEQLRCRIDESAELGSATSAHVPDQRPRGGPAGPAGSLCLLVCPTGSKLAPAGAAAVQAYRPNPAIARVRPPFSVGRPASSGFGIGGAICRTHHGSRACPLAHIAQFKKPFHMMARF